MATGQDLSQSGQSKIYRKQMPEAVTLNGNTITTEEVVDTNGLLNIYGILAQNNLPLPAKATVTITPAAANASLVSFTITDNGGNAITGTPFVVDIWLSDAATGVGLTAVTASGTVAVTTGTLIVADVAKKFTRMMSDTNGVASITITDTAKTGFYVAIDGGGLPLPVVSRQMVTGDYT
jgi:hypothetical protein